MATQLDRRSTATLQTDIEYNQLFDPRNGNAGIIREDPNFLGRTGVGNKPFQYHTTGNGVIHFEGSLFANTDILPLDILTIDPLPESIIPNGNFLDIYGYLTNIGNADLTPCRLRTNENRQLIFINPSTMLTGTFILIDFTYVINSLEVVPHSP